MKIQKLLTIALLINHPAIYAGLNDTGITTCSNATQNGLPCPVAGFPGQDAEYGSNSFDFTKLDANGNAMSVTATNHSCVQDNVTGLMWEVKTDDGGLRDQDNTYTFDEAATFAANVNATNLCGHNDWRVPNIYELVSIEDYSVYAPSIDENFFPYTSNSYYWTNAQYAAYSSDSWIVSFLNGYVYNSYRYAYYAVRLVRVGQWLLPLVFTDQGNGTVTEASTELMWAKCSVGQGATDCSGSASALTWQQALQAADNSTLAGYTDWRLPNVKELQTLVDYTKHSPSINPSVFPNTPSASYYSSSPYAADSSVSWIVDCNDGDVYSNDRNNAVRLVRVGQWLLPFALNVAKTGNGAGSVLSNPAGINCGAVCAANFAQNSSVTLTAAPAAGSVFGGWSGDADCSDGTVTMNTDKNCTATFNLSITVPTATTGTATNITQTSAKLNGTVISSGATATVSFEFGKETSPPSPLPLTEEGGKKTHYSPLLLRRGAGGEVKSFTYTETIAATPSTVYSSTAVAVNANKTDLICGTTYHFRTKAINSAGTGYGTDKTFTTNACIPQPSEYTVTPSVTANGTVNTSTPQTVAYRALQTFTVTPAVGYIKDFIVGGTCPQGSWNENNRWTTGPIIANCSVIFNFTEQPTAWLSPTNPYTTANNKLTLGLHIDSWGVKINTYDFDVNFDPAKLRADLTFQNESGTCSSGVCPGANATTNWNANVDYVTGKITLTGADTQGIGPGNNLELITIHFLPAPNPATTSVKLTLNRLLTTGFSDNIGNGLTGNALVTIQRYQCGDANGDSAINIIDALSIARQIIGLPPPPSITPVADVNQNGEISIVDAMHIARYSLGLVVVGTCLILL